MSVAALVLENGGGEDEAIAALLHDTIEDAGGPPRREEIKEQFGKRIAEIVDGCTDAETKPKPPWKKRKEKYIQHIRRAPREVRLVSLADKLHNARSILLDYRRVGDRVWDRFNPEARDGETQLWYYQALVDAFKDAGGLVEMVDELDRIVKEIEKETSKTDRSNSLQ
jgi:(p)ppGpp synthase/HD superfamily hydrolase